MFGCPFPLNSFNFPKHFSVVYNQKELFIHIIFSLSKPKVCPSVAKLHRRIQFIVQFVFDLRLNLIEMFECPFFVQSPLTS